MAINSKDIETLWKRYPEEGVSNGMSVTQYFESNGVPYHIFEKWYKKKYSKDGIVDCVVSGTPDGGLKVSGETVREASRVEMRDEACVSYVNIGLSNGVKIEHRRLSYGELVSFINKLQSLCSA